MDQNLMKIDGILLSALKETKGNERGECDNKKEGSLRWPTGMRQWTEAEIGARKMRARECRVSSRRKDTRT